MGNNLEKGLFGENQATKYLVSKGYRIIDRNYRTKIDRKSVV